MGFFKFPARRAANFTLVHSSLFLIHFNDVHFRGAEEAHVEDSTDTAGDEDAAVAFEIEEPGGGGGAEGDEIAREGVANLPAVGVAGEHEIPVVAAEVPAAFRVVGEEEHGVRFLPGGVHAGGGGIIGLVPVAQANDAQGTAGGCGPVDGLVAEQGDASRGQHSLYLLLFFVVVIAEDGVGGGNAAELPETVDRPFGAAEAFFCRDHITAEDDEVWSGGGDVLNGFFEELGIVVEVGEEGDAQRSRAGQGRGGQLGAVALQLLCAPFAVEFNALPAEQGYQQEKPEAETKHME